METPEFPGDQNLAELSAARVWRPRPLHFKSSVGDFVWPLEKKTLKKQMVYIIPYYPILSQIILYYPILSYIIPYYPIYCLTIVFSNIAIFAYGKFSGMCGCSSEASEVPSNWR